MSDTPSEAEPRGSASKDSVGKPGAGAGAEEPEVSEVSGAPADEAPADEVPAARTGGEPSQTGSAQGDSGGSGSGGSGSGRAGSGGTVSEKRKAETRNVDTRDLDEDEEWDGPGTGPVVESWFADVQAKPPAPIRDATLWAALATGVLSMLLLGDGLALNLLLVAIPAALGAYYAAQAAGRRPHRWTLVWGVGGLALLSVPALRDADWPSFLAVVAAVAAGSLALHGGRTWTGVLFGPIGLYTSLVTGPLWGWSGLRERSGGARGNVGPVVRALAVAAVLLVVFGALFAGADAAFADLLGGLVPDASVSGGPWHAVLFVIGVVGALVVAHTAAAPVQWDRVEVPAGRPRGRVEWALPLIVLAALFAVFNAVQLAVLFGGYDAVLDKTGQTYAEYARQGFWQLLLVTLLTLLVIVFALRWAPRDSSGDWTLVRAVLGTLCVLALVVVASAVRRMDMYVEAYGLTRLRISVVTVELWLGLVIVLIMAAGVWGARWLPRAVLASAAAGVLAFGLVSPDALIAERNVQRYEAKGSFDLDYARGLSADAAPALDKLDEPLRSCALRSIAQDLEGADKSWYATSLGEARARDILDGRPLSPDADWNVCNRLSTELAYR
ncbi:DUF4153 domain-containing protein [Streptomyces umbrinus]|uniref:DUF4153 domain-containing protein n=1 Tax=Streptomyces umbrinus TaxID=67370 RepID=UPI003F4D84F8